LNQPKRNTRFSTENVFSYSMFAILICVLGLSFFAMQFVVYQPGLVEEVRPMIETKQAHSVEDGSFMLTTVRMSHMNIFHFGKALFDPYMEIDKKQKVFREGESREEYMQRQSINMMTSQSNAVIAAYKQLGVDFTIPDMGVAVLYLYEGMPAEKVLQVGDVISKVDGVEVSNVKDVLKQFEGRAAGDLATLTFTRGETEHTETLELALLPTAVEGQQSRQGLGVNLGTLQTVMPASAEYEVEIEAGEIGGPSAGLMFTLEIYNLLSEIDITKGYRIAGTGTVDQNGSVGVIGGIEHKVVAAHRAEADIFFAPKDWVPEADTGYRPVLNTTDALARAKQLGTTMAIVSVGSVEEALAYLEELPPKS
jgi:PDZ domain-containing protein